VTQAIWGITPTYSVAEEDAKKLSRATELALTFL
jgi:hypothetical protein